MKDTCLSWWNIHLCQPRINKPWSIDYGGHPPNSNLIFYVIIWYLKGTPNFFAANGFIDPWLTLNRTLRHPTRRQDARCDVPCTRLGPAGAPMKNCHMGVYTMYTWYTPYRVYPGVYPGVYHLLKIAIWWYRLKNQFFWGFDQNGMIMSSSNLHCGLFLQLKSNSVD